jgi:hypothetical protein
VQLSLLVSRPRIKSKRRPKAIMAKDEGMLGTCQACCESLRRSLRGMLSRLRYPAQNAHGPCAGYAAHGHSDMIIFQRNCTRYTVECALAQSTLFLGVGHVFLDVTNFPLNLA